MLYRLGSFTSLRWLHHYHLSTRYSRHCRSGAFLYPGHFHHTCFLETRPTEWSFGRGRGASAHDGTSSVYEKFSDSRRYPDASYHSNPLVDVSGVIDYTP